MFFPRLSLPDLSLSDQSLPHLSLLHLSLPESVSPGLTSPSSASSFLLNAYPGDALFGQRTLPINKKERKDVDGNGPHKPTNLPDPKLTDHEAALSSCLYPAEAILYHQ
jgi:hypothetical protein